MTNLRQTMNDTFPRTVSLSVMTDPAGTERTMAFWSSVADLLFDHGRTIPHKAAVLRRYARLVARTPYASLADLAVRLADSYEEGLPGLKVA
ncbi:MAG: hypothetical protein VKO21_02845 [Candidatus Sericytochromatia bacterium]|nr:hypothetical protein [Candidatus Sericytochromatia bacterium]